jgi:hypothetical protein
MLETDRHRPCRDEIAENRARAAWLPLLLITMSLLCGCSDWIKTEYVWTRQAPAMGRKSPTVFVVKISIDRPARTVQWLQDVRDAQGELGTSAKTWTECIFVDDANWQCPPIEVDGVGVVNQVMMRDGVLRELYWSEQRVYKPRRRVAGIRL